MALTVIAFLSIPFLAISSELYSRYAFIYIPSVLWTLLILRKRSCLRKYTFDTIERLTDDCWKLFDHYVDKDLYMYEQEIGQVITPAIALRDVKEHGEEASDASKELVSQIGNKLTLTLPVFKILGGNVQISHGSVLVNGQSKCHKFTVNCDISQYDLMRIYHMVDMYPDLGHADLVRKAVRLRIHVSRRQLGDLVLACMLHYSDVNETTLDFGAERLCTHKLQASPAVLTVSF